MECGPSWKSGIRIAVAMCICLSIMVFNRLAGAEMIDPARTIAWQGNVGVVGGIPTRTNVRDCISDNYIGKGIFYRDLVQDDGPAIAACVNSLAESQVAYLPPGSYRLNKSLNLSAKNNISLRGAGPTQTRLRFYGSSAQGYISIVGNAMFDPPNYTATWAAGLAKGSTVITLSNVSNLSAGSVLVLDQRDDNSTLVWGAGNEGSAQFSRDLNSRHLSQVVSVAAVNATTRQVTISPPLYIDYSLARTPGAYWWISSVTGVGIEDLAIDASADAAPPDYNIDIQYAQNTWVRNIDSNLAKRAHFRIFRAKSIEVRDSSFHHARAYAQTSYGSELWYTSCALIENNIFHTLVAPLLLAAGASGNAFGYNYITALRYDPVTTWLSQSAPIHAAHGLMNLFEANVTPNIYLDNSWGSNSHTTIFRNALSGWQSSKSVNTFPLVFEAHSRFNNVVGNVLGKDGYHDEYEAKGALYDRSTAIYVLGYWGTDHTNLANYDSNVHQTLLRHMNFDYASRSVKYCTSDGGPGCQSGDGSTTLPRSMYLGGKPIWYGGCSWPPVDLLGPTVHDIPAKLRYEGSSCPTGDILNPPRNLR